MNTGTVYTIGNSPLQQNLKALLNACKLADRIRHERRILIKPNLVNAQAPPITTPIALIAALVDYLQSISDAEIIIGEGTASSRHDTLYVFTQLGYADLAAEKKVGLVDLNEEQSISLKNEACRRWPEMHLPEIVFGCFLLSVPVLKAHTLAGVTLTLKNMMGLPPPSHYQLEKSWKKASFHRQINQAVADLNRYRCPDFTLLDASVGMADSHLHGPACEPPVGLLAAGYDPIAIDAYGTTLLGKSWQEIGHIRDLNGELGQAEPLTILRVDPKNT